MSLSSLGAVGAMAAAFFLIYKNKKNNEIKAPTTTQELIRYKNITLDGIVELENHQYRLVVEVEPVNFKLKSQAEQEALWVGFRDMINALTVPVTFLVQIRHLDLKDYVNNLKNANSKSPTPELQEYGDCICNYLSEKTDNIRDRRHYIILKIDAQATASIDSGIKIENEAINALLSDLKPKKSKLSHGEIRDLAHQELVNMAALIQGCLIGMEIPSVRLNREGLLDLIYSTFNRDLAPHARLVDASAQEMFSLTTRSLTPLLAGGANNVQATEDIKETDTEAKTA